MRRKTESKRDEFGRILFDNPADVPAFASDEEEAEWWDTHTPSARYFAVHGEATNLAEYLRRHPEILTAAGDSKSK